MTGPVSSLAIFFRPASSGDMVVVEDHTRMSREEATAYRGRLLAHDTGGEELIFVAGLGDSVLGSVVARREQDGSVHIMRVFVEPAAREVGVGDRLVSGLLEVLREWKCPWVSGTALPGDRQTKNLFERHGLVAQSITVGRTLSGSATGADASR